MTCRTLARSARVLLALTVLGMLTVPPDTAAGAADRDRALADFDFVTRYIEINYAGFPDKVGSQHRAAYDQRTRATRDSIALHPGEAARFMRQWLDAFGDQHVGLEDLGAEGDGGAPHNDASAAEAARLAASGERVTVDSARVRQWRGRADRRDPVLGLWETLDGTYRVLVEREPGGGPRWRGVVLASLAPSWSPGQVKFRFSDSDSGRQGTLWLRDHSPRTGPVRLLASGDAMRFDPLGVWWRRVGADPRSIDRVLPSPEFSLRPLSDSTLWLRVPDFQIGNRETLEALLRDNSALLSRCPNLLIDLRNNSGGSDASYRELMAWLYTHPIYSIGVEFRVGPGTLAGFEALAADTTLPTDVRQGVGTLLGRMRAATGEWATWGDRPFDIHTYPEVRTYPRQVGILITSAGSSGEQFVLAARASRKVTTFGGPTQGVLDYSNQLGVDLPSRRHRLKYSSSRSMRLPDQRVDGHGIAPDIALGDEIEDPVRWVQDWLERRSSARLTPSSR